MTWMTRPKTMADLAVTNECEQQTLSKLLCFVGCLQEDFLQNDMREIDKDLE